ncbi:hypothetical protein GQ42DRAFT_16966 [Ramicandelaber brevisporus]|nr:hypothetical protein GQ42DRAFT_16966 [Ramicandelaber brevisporus]
MSDMSLTANADPTLIETLKRNVAAFKRVLPGSGDALNEKYLDVCKRLDEAEAKARRADGLELQLQAAHNENRKHQSDLRQARQRCSELEQHLEDTKQQLASVSTAATPAPIQTSTPDESTSTSASINSGTGTGTGSGGIGGGGAFEMERKYLKDKIKDLQQQLNAGQSDRDNLRKAEQELTVLRRQIDELNSRPAYNDMRDQLQAAQKTVGKLERDYETTSKRVDQLNKQYTKANSDKEKAKTDLDKTKKALKEAESELRVSRKEVEQLQSKVTELELIGEFSKEYDEQQAAKELDEMDLFGDIIEDEDILEDTQPTQPTQPTQSTKSTKSTPTAQKIIQSSRSVLQSPPRTQALTVNHAGMKEFDDRISRIESLLTSMAKDSVATKKSLDALNKHVTSSAPHLATTAAVPATRSRKSAAAAATAATAATASQIETVDDSVSSAQLSAVSVQIDKVVQQQTQLARQQRQSEKRLDDTTSAILSKLDQLTAAVTRPLTVPSMTMRPAQLPSSSDTPAALATEAVASTIQPSRPHPRRILMEDSPSPSQNGSDDDSDNSDNSPAPLQSHATSTTASSTQPAAALLSPRRRTLRRPTTQAEQLSVSEIPAIEDNDDDIDASPPPAKQRRLAAPTRSIRQSQQPSSQSASTEPTRATAVPVATSTLPKDPYHALIAQPSRRTTVPHATAEQDRCNVLVMMSRDLAQSTKPLDWLADQPKPLQPIGPRIYARTLCSSLDQLNANSNDSEDCSAVAKWINENAGVDVSMFLPTSPSSSTSTAFYTVVIVWMYALKTESHKFANNLLNVLITSLHDRQYPSMVDAAEGNRRQTRRTSTAPQSLSNEQYSFLARVFLLLCLLLGNLDQARVLFADILLTANSSTGGEASQASARMLVEAVAEVWPGMLIAPGEFGAVVSPVHSAVRSAVAAIQSNSIHSIG